MTITNVSINIRDRRVVEMLGAVVGAVTKTLPNTLSTGERAELLVTLCENAVHAVSRQLGDQAIKVLMLEGVRTKSRKLDEKEEAKLVDEFLVPVVVACRDEYPRE